MGRPRHSARSSAGWKGCRSSPIIAFLSAALLCGIAPARADEITATHRDAFGTVGLLDMPSARMAPDGQLALTVGGINAGQHVAASFQALPWLETWFRYSRVPKYYNQSIYYDRSFGFKVRLFKETHWFPDVSLGVRDLFGSGFYGGEYLTSTKRIATRDFGNFDITAGLGWGRLAGNKTFKNPFGFAFRSFKTSPLPRASGTIDFGRFFHGPDTGLFGGIDWYTPIRNLSLLVEYSGDHYPYETSLKTLNRRSPVNIGLSYRPFDNLRLTAGWFYGSTTGAILTFDFDPAIENTSSKLGAVSTEPAIRSDQQQAAAVALYVNGRTSHTQLATTMAVAPERPANMEADGRATFSPITGLADALSHSADAEIDGTALLVSMRAHGDAKRFCSSYAELAAGQSFNTVAIADLDRSDGQITMCQVPAAGTARLIQASARFVQTATRPASPFGTFGGGLQAEDHAPEPAAPPSPAPQRPARRPHRPDMAETEVRIRRDAAAQFIDVQAVRIGTSELSITYTNEHYAFEAAAIGRLARIAMKDAPPDIEVIHLYPLLFGQPVHEIRVLRSSLERIFATHGSIVGAPETLSVLPPPAANIILGDVVRSADYPRFSWSIEPGLKKGVLAPNAPLRIQLNANLSGVVELWPGLSIEGEYQASLYNTFGRSPPAASGLPHVRTDMAKYLTTGKYGFPRLGAAYRTQLAPGVFAEVKAGYLEDMFAGIGGQVLWRPYGKSWALGADLYQVWQRGFDRLFKLQNYNVMTGHVSLYYHSPWNRLDFAVHMGRYLAGDYGATFQVSRHFQTGIEVGAYMTFTNVPFRKFGDGSFDKGIFIQIPLEAVLPVNTQSDFATSLSPLVRDGGQRLNGDDSLFYETRRTSEAEITRYEEDIIDP